ncbi:hypothetical protein FALCPG4_015406 [Fusarium falciforme]
MDETSNLGRSALGMACANGAAEVVDVLLKKGADLIVKNSDGWTPLYAASTKGHVEVVKMLLKVGADITVGDSNRRTPLYAASGNGHVEVVKLLLKKGADITVVKKYGETSLHAASYNGYVKVVKLLLGIPSVDASKTDRLGHTALFLASRYRQHQAVQVLLSDGRINPGTKD